MKFDNLIIIILATIILFCFGGTLIDSYISSKRDIELAKAGLVQKETTQGKIIWVKLEEVK